MRDFTETELERMQSTQESAMQDTCVVMAYEETRDTYNNPSPDYVDRAESTACGLEYRTPNEVQDSGRVPVIEPWLRLPIDTVLDPRDRIRVTDRYGVELADAPVFEVVGPVKRGPSGLVVRLRLVD